MNELKSLEGILAPASKLDLGSDLQSVSKLQESFSSTKPQFMVCAGLEIFTHTHVIRFRSQSKYSIPFMPNSQKPKYSFYAWDVVVVVVILHS